MSLLSTACISLSLAWHVTYLEMCAVKIQPVELCFTAS